jgi:hypothetical protein
MSTSLSDLNLPDLSWEGAHLREGELCGIRVVRHHQQSDDDLQKSARESYGQSIWFTHTAKTSAHGLHQWMSRKLT